jgi:hypothetical protein
MAELVGDKIYLLAVRLQMVDYAVDYDVYDEHEKEPERNREAVPDHDRKHYAERPAYTVHDERYNPIVFVQFLG